MLQPYFIYRNLKYKQKILLFPKHNFHTISLLLKILIVLFLTGLTSNMVVKADTTMAEEQRMLYFRWEETASKREPLANADVRLLCYNKEEELATDLRVQTDQAGTAIHVEAEKSLHEIQLVPSAELLTNFTGNNCTSVVALKLEQSEKTYDVYYSSRHYKSTNIKPRRIVIKENRPLIAFNLVVSIEWEPALSDRAMLMAHSGLHTVDSFDARCNIGQELGEVPPYIEDIHYGLCRASEFLYRATDGQMLFGNIQIHTGGRNWDEADIRIRASNTQRPMATIGGIFDVHSPWSHILNKTSLSRGSGAIDLGRCWDGNNAACLDKEEGIFTSDWSQPPGFRTIGHELGHYLAWLGDKYYVTTPDGVQARTCEHSSMDNQYENRPKWWETTDDKGQDEMCADTEQTRINGDERDWETIGHAYPWLMDPSSPNYHAHAQDISLVDALFHPHYDLTPGVEQFFESRVGIHVDTDISEELLQASQSEIYSIFKYSGNSAAAVTYQGTTPGDVQGNDLGTAVILGAAKAQTHIYATFNVYPSCNRSGGRFVSPRLKGMSPLREETEIRLQSDRWGPSLDFGFNVTGGSFSAMTVELRSHINQPDGQVTAQFCSPDASVGCSNPKSMNLTTGLRSTFFTAADFVTTISSLPTYGVLRIESELGEVYSTVQYMGNIGPTNIWGLSPILDGNLIVTPINQIKQDGHLFVTSEVNYQMLAEPLSCESGDMKITQPLGNIHLVSSAGSDKSESMLSDRHDMPAQIQWSDSQETRSPVVGKPLDVPISVQWFYDRNDQEELAIVHFDPERQNWKVVSCEQHSSTSRGMKSLDRLVLPKANQGGVFAIAAIEASDSLEPCLASEQGVEPTQLSQIQGVKFNDQNGNGIQDEGEPGLGRQVITLTGPGRNSFTTQTDGRGAYSFGNLFPGTYSVVAASQAGWTQTYPDDLQGHTITIDQEGMTVKEINFGSQKEQVLFLSSTTGGRVNGFQFQDEDILIYSPETEQWHLYFDGSDVGLGRADINALHVLDDGNILMSFNTPRTINRTRYDDSDIALFKPTSIGARTKGEFSLYFDGSDVGLTTAGEDIDAIAITPDGNLVISTLGTANVTGVVARDEDLMHFADASLGKNTRGTWSLYFDGSDVGLTAKSEDISAAWIDEVSQEIHLNMAGNYTVNDATTETLRGDSDDLFICDPVSLEPNAHCHFNLFWDGDSHNFGRENVDGYAMGSMPEFSVLSSGFEQEVDEEINDQQDDDVLEEEDIKAQIYMPLIVQ